MAKAAKKSAKANKILTLFQHKTFTAAFFLVVFGLLGGAIYLMQSSAYSWTTVKTDNSKYSGFRNRPAALTNSQYRNPTTAYYRVCAYIKADLQYGTSSVSGTIVSSTGSTPYTVGTNYTLFCTPARRLTAGGTNAPYVYVNGSGGAAVTKVIWQQSR